MTIGGGIDMVLILMLMQIVLMHIVALPDSAQNAALVQEVTEQDTAQSRFRWERFTHNPVFPAVPGTWMESQTANPDMLLIGDTCFMYFRGQQGGHDRIGVATIPRERFDGFTWSIRPQPVIDIGEPGSWDETHVLDPASVLVNGKVFLYYSSVSRKSDRAICLAVSEDGIHFKKYEANPVVVGGGPEVVYRDGVFYLYYWKRVPGSKGFQIHLATSQNGLQFSEYEAGPVVPVGPEGSWDSHTVETPRIFNEKGMYYMTYCGSNRHNDYPADAGLATSRDLVHWTKYPHNPIFSRGAEHEWDEGAIWFTTVEKIDDRYFMWYEGYGGGTARTEPYGSYLKGGKSQVGMAVLKAPFFYVPPE